MLPAGLTRLQEFLLLVWQALSANTSEMSNLMCIHLMGGCIHLVSHTGCSILFIGQNFTLNPFEKKRLIVYSYVF